MKRLTTIKLPMLTLAGLMIVGSAVMLGGAHALAASASEATNQACQGIGLVGGSGGCGDQGAQVDGVITTFVNVLSTVVGVIAVIMIIISGAKFMTAGGDANAVSGAKKTLIYALVGLVVVALAETLVHFVLGKV